MRAQQDTGRWKQSTFQIGLAATLLALIPVGCFSAEGGDGTCGDSACEPDSSTQDNTEIPVTENIPRSQLGGTVPGLEALDILLVVDNSGSMSEEQETLATSIYNLVTSLVSPVPGDGIGAAVNDVRVALASSDLGLQYGGMPGPQSAVGGCSDVGDNGALQTSYASRVTLLPGVIDCTPSGAQCPSGWSCGDGTCSPTADAATEFDCPNLASAIVGLSSADSRANLALSAACLAQVGTGGCGVEQQLESSIAALKRNPEFLRSEALLAVVVVSDEDDCSIESKDLFSTEQFNDRVKGLNMACNFPVQNEDYLYSTSRYREALTALKGNENAVLFAAFVGVPTAFESSCKGLGTWLGACLDNPEMQLEPMEIADASSGQSYWHFRPACVRDDNPQDDKAETQARPGRRYVHVVQDFGENGYLSSICDRTWKVSMQQVKRMIGARLGVLAD